MRYNDIERRIIQRMCSYYLTNNIIKLRPDPRIVLILFSNPEMEVVEAIKIVRNNIIDSILD